MPTVVGTFQQQVGTGNQTVSGLGMTPKAVLFFTTGATALDAFGTFGVMSVGAAVSSSNRAAVGVISEDAQADADTYRRHVNSKCITILTVNGATSDEADFVSFASGEFTINWTTNGGNQRFISYIAFDCTDAKVVEFASPTSTGNQATTGAGFQPDAVIFFTIAHATAPDNTDSQLLLGLGFTNGTGQGASGISSQDGTAASNAHRYQRTDRCIAVPFNGSAFIGASIVSLDADGFTVNWATVQASARYCWALCLKGGSFYVGSETQKTSTGTQAKTGVGFQPDALLLSWVQNTATTSVATFANLNVGAASGSAQAQSWMGDAHAADPTGVDRIMQTDKCLLAGVSGTPSVTSEADLDSLDSDGFTLDWTTADANAREFVFLAHKTAAPAAGASRLVNGGLINHPIFGGLVAAPEY